jgi:hypothetical protein
VKATGFYGAHQIHPFSPRAATRTGARAISYSLPPEELLNTYLPQFSGMLTLLGRNGIHLHSRYLGVAVFAARQSRIRNRNAVRRSMLWFWLVRSCLDLWSSADTHRSSASYTVAEF